jgi:hyperosmotically inducible protein
MFRALLRLILVLIVLAAVGAFLLGYRLNVSAPGSVVERPVGTTGSLPKIDTERARDPGAAIGEKVASGAAEAQRLMSDGALTAKIKSKMALDDSVEASAIDVTTSSGVVTVSGTVRSEAERTRAIALARETNGVKSVVDQLRMR